jgi:hypothetical protein
LAPARLPVRIIRVGEYIVTVREKLLQEIETLPEGEQREVLHFVRLLRFMGKDRATAQKRLDAAIAEARRLAAERGITDEDIAAEIRAVREGRE